MAEITHQDAQLLVSLGVVGVIVGIAKMLVSNEPIKARHAIGRAILSGALGVAAAAAVIFMPGLSFVAQVGIACVISSLGASAIESAFQKWLKK